MHKKLKLSLHILLLILLIPAHMLSQKHLDVEGDAWVKEKLELNSTGPSNGEFIWNQSGSDIEFFTGFTERLRINGAADGGDVMIFEMDTITEAQDITAGNVVRLADGTLALRQYKVGDMAQGGIVFWVDETGEHGLVSSLSDLEGTVGDFGHLWSGLDEVTGATGDGIGAGAMNTMLIVSAQRGDTDSAARLCADLLEDGYGDWYLPSLHELNLMRDNLHTVDLGDFKDTSYWSSTEFGDADAFDHNFANDVEGVVDKDYDLNRVRAIRAF